MIRLLEKLPLETCRQIGNTCIAGNLRRADRVVAQIYDDAFRSLGLRGTQFTVLIATRYMEPVTMSILAEKLAMDRTTFTRNVKPMFKQRWLEMVTGNDRRERCLSLTPDGQRLVIRAHRAWQSAQEHVGEIFGRENRAALVKQLKTLTAVFRDE